jgi:hypothetical protein
MSLDLLFDEFRYTVATTEQASSDFQFHKVGRAVTKVKTILGEGACCSIVNLPLDQDDSLLKKGQGLLVNRRSFV